MIRYTYGARGVRFDRGLFLGAMVIAIGLCSVVRADTTLLNTSFASGNRTDSSGVVQPVWVGASTSDNASYFTTGTETLNDAANTVTGKMQNLIGTGSRKVWTYFTPDLQTPDTNSPPSDVLAMTVGQTLTASMSFVIPSTVYTTGNVPGPSANTLADLSGGSAKKTDFRFGLFYDPGSPTTSFNRTQQDTNSDSGNQGSTDTTNRWQFSQGYGFSMPIGTNASALQASSTQIGKRVNNTGSANLFSSTGNYALATTGGTATSFAFDTPMTVEMKLHLVAAGQMDVTANVYVNSVLTSTNTVSDLGTGDSSTATFGGPTNTYPGNVGVQNAYSVYTKFDQMFLRIGGGSTDTHEIDITNFKVTLASAILLGDMNFDGHVNASDISAMQLALSNLNGYLSTNFGNGTPTSHGVTSANIGSYSDVNGTTTYKNSNLQALLTYLKAGHGSEAVPEPSTLVLAGLGAAAIGLVASRRKKAA
jgi:hypothetical protein